MIKYNWPAEMIADYACSVGENPIWHASQKRLLWTDIPNGRLYQYIPATNTHESFYQGRPVGGFTIQQDGSLLLFKNRGTVTNLKGGKETTIIPEMPEELEQKFNDVIADPAGRVFCGTFTRGKLGRLYRLDTDGSITKLLDGIGCSNGMAFNLQRNVFYYTDSFARTIYRFDYDESDGAIRNQKPFYVVPENQGFPDGCTVDSDDCLWFASWSGSSIVRLDPEGKAIGLVPIPANKTTSLTFAGDDLKDMYVTSEGGEHRTKDDPHAGALFRVRSEIAGRPEYSSKIRIPVGVSK